MGDTLRAFLVALAVLSGMLVETPATAGMVGTPAVPPEERQAALDRAANGVPGAAESLKALPAADLFLLAALPESQRRAANDAVVALLVIAAIVLFIGLIVTVIIIDRVRRHRRHLGGQADPEPRPVAATR
ncbi:MAG: hypothetical protein IT452_22585 [Planctomycetia bacterium]|nr:hypothetical protein [Planctomycetia bacterium]